jgi:hypothetical protein
VRHVKALSGKPLIPELKSPVPKNLDPESHDPERLRSGKVMVRKSRDMRRAGRFAGRDWPLVDMAGYP